jgi:hypothetical protein
VLALSRARTLIELYVEALILENVGDLSRRANCVASLTQGVLVHRQCQIVRVAVK